MLTYIKTASFLSVRLLRAGLSAPLALIVSFGPLSAVPTSNAALGAKVQALPRVAVPGQRISVSGSGFRPEELVILFWDQRRFSGSDEAIKNGTISKAYVYVPANTSSGRHILRAMGSSSRRSASVAILVPPPTVQGVPLIMRPGQRFGVKGAGFGAKESLLFYWDGKHLVSWRATTSTVGTFQGVFGSVPKGTPRGRHTLLVRGHETGRSVRVQITITKG